MVGFPSPFGGDDAQFDDYDEFVPEHLPEPGPFLDDWTVLTDGSHVAVHEMTRDVFEERTVYDMTFGYNLARLNLDARHPNAGYRYADGVDGDDDALCAEFTPTTPFCPQSHTLTIGSFRAWNGLSDRHEYDIVRVRVHPMHHESEAINRRLAELEETFRETGTVPQGDEGRTNSVSAAGGPSTRDTGSVNDSEEGGSGPRAPF